ncbi:MAG: heterodisulfide reductase-related iron-sulfur binding cluster, partial [Nocardioides sp.]|uniref:heterodisulfide reductase-related iron-sulfur binding cluster n=1 Tax=Nocardioides sp. TaxID=35761 RepID=UPI00239C5C87
MFQIIAIVLSLALTAWAVVAVTLTVRRMTATMRVGQPAVGRTDEPVKRTITMVKETFGHTRMLQWTWVGIMHWFVYLAFIVLSTAVATGYVQLFKADFVLPIIGHWYPLEWLYEALGVLGTVGIVFLAIYRQKHHPRSLGRKSRFFGSTAWQAYFVEAFVLLEGSAILFIRGAEYNLIAAEGGEHGSRVHFPVSSYFGDALFSSNIGTLENTIYAIALFKIVLAMIWLLVIARNITMGVAWHRFTAWPNIWFKRESSGRTALGAVKPLTSDGKPITLDDIDDLDEDSKLGVGAVEDFSWKGILDFTTCTECGRCQSQCPAWNTDKPLSPKLLITALRDATYAKAPYLTAPEAEREALLEGDTALKTEVERPLIGDTGGRMDGIDDGEWFYNPTNGSAVIDPEVLWNCTSCGACVQQCPVDIEHVDHIIDMRRHAILVESNFPSELNGLFKGLENKGNPWNMSASARMDWAKGLDFDVPVVGEDLESLESVDWLFWVGCAGAYEDRAKKTTRAVAELLNIAGISFGVLGNGETCTGDPARRAGNEFVFQGLAQQNVETMKEYKVKKVVSTCAHCFNTLKNEYSEFGIELEVVHHTQLLNRLVREGKLTPVKDGAGAHKRSITYHDPCYIGRHNGVYTPPRELLEILPGAEFVEMERNSERSFCCGAGGGRMWMEENIGERINVNRTKEAVGTGADQIAVGCPFCRVMLSDGLTMQQSKGEAREEVEILDVAQMLLASVKGEQATKLAPGEGAAAAPAAKKAAPEKPVETKAEPEAGDVTTEEPESTVTETADAGPAAKASGGSSLFDDAADTPAETADQDKAPAEEAQAAKPASSGGSLFDVGGDDDVQDEPAATTESAAPAEKSEPAATKVADESDGLGSGSLFDLGGDEPETPAPEPTPDGKADDKADEKANEEADEKAEDAAEATSTPASEAAPAEKSAPAEPSTDLGSGGSLFDLPAPAEPEPKAAAEPETKTAPEPKAEVPEPEPAQAPETPEPAAEPAPAVDLNTGGSLFDIAAAEPPAAQAAPSATPSAAQTEAGDAADVAEEAAEPEAATQSAPVADLSSGGSLFDIAAPEAAESTAAPEKTAPEKAAP